MPDLADRFSNTRLVDNLRQYHSELEIQNKALRFSQAEAEGASERFVTLFSHVPLALMVVEETGQILETNGRALDLFRPLESDPPLSFLHPLVSRDGVDRVRLGFLLAKEQGAYELDELEFSGGSNGPFTGDLHIAQIDDPLSDLPRFICAVIDQGPLLAQRHALELSTQALQEGNEQLLQSQTRLAAIINSSLDAILCVDKNHQIIVFNPSAATVFQCATDQALGRPLTDFLPDAAHALSYGDITSHAQLGEMIGITSQGDRVSLEVSLSFEHHADGDVITLFARDLTARKKMEAHRTALESQLRESQKMQAIGTMAGGIAHDFNNIISAILGNVALARLDACVDNAITTSLTEIDKAGRRARDLVRQILTFSRNEPPHRAPLHLADVVDETLRLVKVTMPPHVTLHASIDETTPPVLADATQIEQALLNLCTNAIHAMAQQPGTLRVELAYALRAPDDASERRGGLRGQHVRLTVSDSGSGMSDATQERIFEPFFTTKPVGQGTGLGLSVVHGIMRAHMGNVRVQSTLGQGSTFTLYFPVTDVAVEPLSPLPAEAAAVTGSGQCVMYVDDDEALVFLVKRLLTRKGYRVVTFTDPLQALAALRDDRSACDLLVTDYNMPGYSGVDLLREVKALMPALPVALASGYVTPEIERDAVAAGARALIHKPNDVDELCATVQKLLTETYKLD
jgi:two-component system cell cycle sensor histidine kinase/response regulator CckA